LFHPRVIKNHSKHVLPVSHSSKKILEKWSQNLKKNILDVETKNDGDFIQQILINVLGFVGRHDGAEWTVEKNQPVGSGNVDVALGVFTNDSVKIVAPFELKGASYKDLDVMMSGRNKTPVQQAWEYGMDAEGAKFVIVSNYREIRLYAIGRGRKRFESFDLSNLTDPEEYARFYLLLSADNLLNGVSEKILLESEQVDEEITKELYAEYKSLRSIIIAEIDA